MKRNKNDNYRIPGRVEDVINVSGYLPGTAEIENSINEHPLVNESAVIGYAHTIKRKGIYACVVFPISVRVAQKGLKHHC